jgi:hypothetical protein
MPATSRIEHDLLDPKTLTDGGIQGAGPAA